MGASQEKKKRRMANAEAVAKTVKTKKRMPKWAKAAIIILALALVIGAIFYFTSGYFYRNTTAVRLGDTGLPALSSAPEGLRRFLADALERTRRNVR